MRRTIPIRFPASARLRFPGRFILPVTNTGYCTGRSRKAASFDSGSTDGDPEDPRPVQPVPVLRWEVVSFEVLVARPGPHQTRPGAFRHRPGATLVPLPRTSR
jgi:hypothetical protein